MFRLLVVSTVFLCFPSDAFRAKLKGRPLHTLTGSRDHLEAEEILQATTDRDGEQEGWFGWARRLMSFGDDVEELVDSVIIDSAMDQAAREKVRGKPLSGNDARRRLRGGRGGGGRSSGRSSYSASRGSSSPSAAKSSYSGYKGTSTKPKTTNAVSRSTSKPTRSTSAVSKTTYTYTSKTVSTSKTWTTSSTAYRSGYTGYYYPITYGIYFYPVYTVRASWSWSSSDYCYSCNRFGSQGQAYNMKQEDLAAIDAALDVLYSTDWDTKKTCDDTGMTCVSNPDHFKAMILDFSAGFDVVRALPQIKADWDTYTKSTTRNVVYTEGTCAATTYQPTDATKQECAALTNELACDNSSNSACQWFNQGDAAMTANVDGSQTRATEKKYYEATEQNRYALMNQIEWGREEVYNGAVQAGLTALVAILCVTFAL